MCAQSVYGESLCSLVRTQLGDGGEGRVALLAPGREAMSYAGLGRQIEYIRASLGKTGIGRQDRVAVVAPNGPEMVTSFLGIADCAVFAPLNPGLRREEFAYYFEDLDVAAIVLKAGNTWPAREVAEGQRIPILEIEVSANDAAGAFTICGIDSRESASEWKGNQGDDTALILHTSGTTSRPKQVPLSHANLCASAVNVASSLRLGPADRCLNVMPLFHIHGLVAAVLGSLASGGSIVCTPGFDVRSYFSWIEAYSPTWYTAVPTMHQAILGAIGGHEELLRSKPLRFVRSSSASLPPAVMAGLEAAFHAPVIEAYGMTEAAHQMACNPLPPAERKAGSVGIPAGPEIAILDKAGNPLPNGDVGEISIRGANVMLGYVNNPDANRAGFTDGWFRTGDEGSFDSDGYLRLRGRLKEQINRGGEKISPREIDEVILRHPKVAQAVAFAVPHATLGEDLAVAVVARANEPPPTEWELRDFAFQHLADAKVPSAFVIVNEIPKGPTGKLQRIGLADKLSAYLKPVDPQESEDLTECEEIVRDVWQEILNRTHLNKRDNFFLLGGDSLSATLLAGRMEEVFEVKFTIAELFLSPTIEAQGKVIEGRLAS